MIALLTERGIGARGYYRTPLHRQPALGQYAIGAVPLPVSEKLAATNIALPMGPALAPEQVQEVVAAVAEAFAVL
jgi:dTDP-3-amino-3,4,6-trideoxy-alpha-D-glucose transaminase